MNRPYQQFYPAGVPTEIDADAWPSVTAMLDDAVVRYADKTAFVAGSQRLTYAETARLSEQFCAYLQGMLKVARGERIAVMLPNVAAFPIAFLGIARAGAVQVNLNPLYTARELAHQLNDAGCTAIVLMADALPTLTACLADAEGPTALRHAIVVDRPLGLAPQIAGLASAVDFVTAIEQGAHLPRHPVSLSGEDLLFLQYTGGTTGRSKGAMLSHRNLVANTEQYKAFMGPSARPGEEVMVTALPLYHIYALMHCIAYFSLGAENWLVANPRNLDGFIDILKAARPTVFMGVNTLYAGLTQHPRIAEVDFSRLVGCGGGGAAVVRATSERWQQISGQFIREGYGLSETSPIVSFNPMHVEEFTGTTGLPVPSTDVKLLDADDREVAPGCSGEVCVKGPQVMRGYWNQPEANLAAFTADGYFRTGDVGVFDERGNLKIVDRKKDMILVSGFNVYPNEVEDVASTCPGVAECACVGVADARSGEAVKLYVVRSRCAAGAALDENSLIGHCRALLAAYKTPRHVEFVATLPKSNVGKILRRELRSAT